MIEIEDSLWIHAIFILGGVVHTPQIFWINSNVNIESRGRQGGNQQYNNNEDDFTGIWMVMLLLLIKTYALHVLAHV